VKRKTSESSDKVCVLFFTDGRDEYTSQMLESFTKNVKFEHYYSIMLCDNPTGRNSVFLEGIKKKYKINQLVLNDERLGIFGSVQKAWALIPDDCTYVWHQENDFLFNEPVNVKAFMEILENRNINQVALLRQAWYENEVKAGGIFQANDRAYKNGVIKMYPVVLHREYFTHNPSLYRKDVIRMMKNYTEYTIMSKLPGYCAFWGTKTDKPRVTHIGEQKI
jgi:hypothetical protein